MTDKSFLVSYAEAFANIPGWFSIDAYLLMCLYHQLALAPGDVLEIGVYHGLSAIGVAALRGPNRRFFAIDPFLERAKFNAELRDKFLKTMREFYGALDFMTLYAQKSNAVPRAELQGNFSLVHVDGDHSAACVLHDLELAHALLEPNGVLVVDDYNNLFYPGVSYGVHEYLRVQPKRFRVVAGGLNKLILLKEPASKDVNGRIRERFANFSSVSIKMWDDDVLLYPWGMGVLVDLEKSTPNALVLNPRPALRAKIESTTKRLRARQGEIVQLQIMITNLSSFAFQSGNDEPIKLTYRVRDARGQVVAENAPRTPLEHVLYPEQTLTMPLRIPLALQRGRYVIEIDLVWEKVAWFHECGSRILAVRLDVA